MTPLNITEPENKLFQTGNVHGVAVNLSNPQQALQELELLIQDPGGHYVCFFEGNLYSRILHEPKVKEVINGASLIYPDGIAVAKSLSLNLGYPVSRVSGPSFLLDACEYGLSRNWRHFFLGGSEGIAERLAEQLKKRYPDLQVAGCYCPPFRQLTPKEEDQVKQQIEEAGTDLLWVGLGGPKQEFWMQAHQGKIMVPIMLGVGAAFDFHTGNRPWAPPLIRKMGLEWFFRAVSGGRNTMVRNVKCVTRVAVTLFTDFVTIKAGFRRKSTVKKKIPTKLMQSCQHCDGRLCALSMPYCPYDNCQGKNSYCPKFCEEHL